MSGPTCGSDHLVRQLAQLGVQGFQTIGSFETDPQCGEYVQPMERQPLFESLVQAVGGERLRVRNSCRSRPNAVRASVYVGRL